MDASRYSPEASILFFLDPLVVVIMNIFFNCFYKGIKGVIGFFIAVIHFVFHPSEECFHNAIVIAVTFSRHGLNNSMFFLCRLEIFMLVLSALVRMKN